MSGIFTKGGTGVGSIVITSSAIITTITTSSNWSAKGKYTGSTAGLVDGNFYYDNKWNQKYVYDGTILRRFTYNQLKN